MYSDENVTSWVKIDWDGEPLGDTTIDEAARAFIYDKVDRTLDSFFERNEPLPASMREWNEILFDEIMWEKKNGSWLTEDVFDAFCAKCDELLPFFLANLPETATVITDWDND